MSKFSLAHCATLRLPGIHYKVELWTREQESIGGANAPSSAPAHSPPSAPDAPVPPEQDSRTAAPPPESPRPAPDSPTGSETQVPPSSTTRRRGPSPDPEDAPEPTLKSRRVR